MTRSTVRRKPESFHGRFPHPRPSRACNTKEAITSFYVLVKWKCVTCVWRVERSTRLKFLARVKKSSGRGHRRNVDGSRLLGIDEWLLASKTANGRRYRRKQHIIRRRVAFFRKSDWKEETESTTKQRRLEEKSINERMNTEENCSTLYMERTLFRAARRMFHEERKGEWKSDRWYARESENRFWGEDKCKKFQRPEEEEQNDKKVATNYETFSGIFTL